MVSDLKVMHINLYRSSQTLTRSIEQVGHEQRNKMKELQTHESHLRDSKDRYHEATLKLNQKLNLQASVQGYNSDVDEYQKQLKVCFFKKRVVGAGC